MLMRESSPSQRMWWLVNRLRFLNIIAEYLVWWNYEIPEDFNKASDILFFLYLQFENFKNTLWGENTARIAYVNMRHHIYTLKCPYFTHMTHHIVTLKALSRPDRYRYTYESSDIYYFFCKKCHFEMILLRVFLQRMSVPSYSQNNEKLHLHHSSVERVAVVVEMKAFWIWLVTDSGHISIKFDRTSIFFPFSTFFVFKSTGPLYRWPTNFLQVLE